MGTDDDIYDEHPNQEKTYMAALKTVNIHKDLVHCRNKGIVIILIIIN